LGAAAEEARRVGDGHRQAPSRPGVLCALDLLPAHRRGSAHDRAHRDGVERDARRVLRRHDPDRARGTGEPSSDPRGAGDDARARRRQAGGARPAAAKGAAGGPSGPRAASFRLLVTEPLDGAANMALDEALMLGRLRHGSPPTLRFFAWAPPAISLGYGQRLDGRIDERAVEALGLGLVRRPTGGSAILHEGPELEITYSVAAGAGGFDGT